MQVRKQQLELDGTTDWFQIDPARISFKYEGEIKSFSDKQKLREFCTTKPALMQNITFRMDKQQGPNV